jgi:hypothetical protein
MKTGENQLMFSVNTKESTFEGNNADNKNHEGYLSFKN